MNNLQKVGGIAALIHSAAYIFGLGLYFAVLSPILEASADQFLAMLGDYQNLMYVWIFIAYMVSGLCLVAVSLALHERLKDSSPALGPISTVLGLIWACLIIGSGNLMLFGFLKLADLYAVDPAQAKTVLLTLEIVENGIVSSTEFIGGTWALLVSWAALKTGALPRALNLFGLVIGLAGILSVVPAFNEVGAMVFALSMIVWFMWLGFVLLRSRSNPITQQTNSLAPQGKTA